jgi:two-component system phosphate regulon sensor histidine kinase PhoR
MEREKDNITSMFAHDMKSSLSIIGGFVMRLLKKGENMDAGKKDKYFEIIQNETGKLEFMINDFLEFARLQTGKLKMNFQATSLEKLMMELYDAYQSRAMQSGIRFEFLAENILPVINADPERFRRVFTNLLDNAFKFTEKGGIIIMLAEETEEEINIAIEDSGKGIDPDELPFIFDIFHRGKDSNEIAGVGIGLATVKAIVEGHGGRVSVESKPGEGSIFTVILPKFQRSEDRVLKQSSLDDQPEFPS